MADKWTVRDKHGVVSGPHGTEEVGALITSGKVPPTVFVSCNGSGFRPAGEWPQLQGFKAPERRDWRALWPLAAVLLAGLVIYGAYRVATRPEGGAAEVIDDGLDEIVGAWPDAIAVATVASAEEAKTSDPGLCERRAAGALRLELGNDRALRLLAVCSAVANRFGVQKQRDALAELLRGRGEAYAFERGALLSTMPQGERGAEAEALLRPAIVKNDAQGTFLLARLLVQRLPEHKPSAAADPRFQDAWAVLEPIAAANPELVLDWSLKSARFNVFARVFATPKTSDTPFVIRWYRATLGCDYAAPALAMLAAAADVRAETLSELGLAAAACKIASAEQVLRPFETHTDAKKKRAAKIGLAALRLADRDLEGAKGLLYDVDKPADADEDAAANRYVRAAFALHLGDLERALELFHASTMPGGAFGAFVAERMQGRDLPAPMIFGPGGAFVTAVLSDRVDDVRLDPLFDAADVLHALNPAKVPLLEAMVAAPIEQLRKKAKPSEADRALLGLFDAWIGVTPKTRAVGEGGTLVAAELALAKKQPAEALRALDRLATAGEALPQGIAALKARALEATAPEAAEELWAQLAEGSEDLDVAAEMAAARALLRSGDTAGGAGRYQVLYWAGDAPLEVTYALSMIDEREKP